MAKLEVYLTMFDPLIVGLTKIMREHLNWNKCFTLSFSSLVSTLCVYADAALPSRL